MKLKSWKEIPIGGIIIDAGNSQENKTGSWSDKQPQINTEKCTKCYRCISACPEKAIKKDKAGNVVIDHDHCKGCGICAQVCPSKAIKM
ncbi:MAG: 4Fe-4S binding protein [Patescibacteria group bacterium]|nr:4Fe-4S binding protein [Patescibacteria group bacterium]